IETYGCSSNKADSMIMEHVLQEAGYKKVPIEKAAWLIINTCAVKQQTENKIKHRFKELEETYGKDPRKRIIVAGCFPYISQNYIDVVKEYIPSYAAIIGLDNVQRLPRILENVNSQGKNIVLPSEQKVDKAQFLVDYPPGKITGIVPISEGCVGQCTYCCVKNARGQLFCYNPDNIIRNVRHQLSQGIKQIYLTSQDCSIYEFDGTNLEDLISRISKLDYQFFLRLGMINPRFLIDNLDQLLSIYQLDNVYQFLHIPVQSASDEILKKMRRPYLKSEIIDKIGILRERFPNLTISTDIICGFPGETEYDFYKTINFIKWLRPEILNISKYTMRPGTLAKKMEQIDSKIIKERSIRLSRVFRMLIESMNQKWLGWEGKMLLLHHTKKTGQVFGRNYAYKNIFLDSYNGKLGEFIKVEIKKIDGFNLYAERKD
ncbi:MAG: tRNA (N(6)-L-threonylcarbamoyladenosine(37)-C(2))-methylthiotransferase, partial [Promethearchaeia archaeon]